MNGELTNYQRQELSNIASRSGSYTILGPQGCFMFFQIILTYISTSTAKIAWGEQKLQLPAEQGKEKWSDGVSNQ